MRKNDRKIVRVELSHEQLEFVRAPELYPCFCGGFGSGKTFAAVMRAISLKLRYPALSVAYYLPTYDLVRTIAFPRFAEAFDMLGVQHNFNRAENVANIPGAAQIIFRTMDTPERIVGYEVADSLCDEIDTLLPDHAQDVWNRVIARNRQKKPDGATNTVGVATTPEGFRFAYDRWQKNPAQGYRLIKARTSSNAVNLPADYETNLRASYSPNLLRAYLDGEFVNLRSGNVYPDFDRARAHAAVAAESGETLHVGMDFNVMNMTAIISVIRGDRPITVAELTGVRDTPTMAALLRARYQGHAITVYPDASGSSRKSVNAQESDHAILKQHGFTVLVNPSNPAVRDRVNAVNKIIPQWKINTDNCQTLTQALEQQAYDKNGEPDKSGGHDHANDAAGYFIAHRWPLVRRMATVTALRI